MKHVDWDKIDQGAKDQFLKNFESVKVRKITYNKPLCIIYNPVSGKKTNLLPLMENKLKIANVPYELIPTQKAFDPYEFARDLDYNLYSVLVSVGGDGTIHEVVNGMLSRKDGAKLPIAIIPNGSGDDLCSSIGIMNVD